MCSSDLARDLRRRQGNARDALRAQHVMDDQHGDTEHLITNGDRDILPTLLGGGQGRHAELAIAFAESPCRFVCEVDADAAARMGEHLGDIPWAWVGEVDDDAVLTVTGTDDAVERVPVADLARAWRGDAASA